MNYYDGIFKYDDDKNILSTKDYKLENENENLTLLDCSKFMFLNKQINLIKKQKGNDCALTSILNIMFQSGKTADQIYEQLKTFDDFFNLDIIEYNHNNIEEVLLDYCIKCGKFSLVDAKNDNKLTPDENGGYLDGGIRPSEASKLLEKFGISVEQNRNFTVDELIVCRLGFNPTSKNWDIESKTKLKKAA